MSTEIYVGPLPNHNYQAPENFAYQFESIGPPTTLAETQESVPMSPIRLDSEEPDPAGENGDGSQPMVVASQDEGAEMVCFGMVPSIPGRCESKDWRKFTSHLPVKLESSTSFSAMDEPAVIGRISGSHSQIIQGLLEEQSLELHATCVADEDTASGKTSYVSTLITCTLDITVYGPSELFDEIGSWFQDYDIYLQDPPVCHNNVRYYNPQRLSTGDLHSCPMLEDIVSRPKLLEKLHKLVDQQDFLDTLSTDIELEEAPQPPNIETSLQRLGSPRASDMLKTRTELWRRHQKQALTFMHSREHGWSFGGSRPDIWDILDTESGRV